MPQSSSNDVLPVAVIGAGPAGLAALAELLDRGLPAVVLEAADQVGASLRDFGHVQLFSPWRYNIAAPVAARLAASGWTAPDPDVLPTAAQIVERVLVPFAQLPQVQPHLRLAHRVLSITRDGFDKVKTEGRAAAPFVISVHTPAGEQELRARAVIDASGTWFTPNPLGASGLAAIGEEEARDLIHYGIPDILGSQRDRYLGRRVLVVGAGHSAANALIALAQLAQQDAGTELVWAVRGTSVARVFGGGDADALPARGALGTALRRLHAAGRLQLVTDFRIKALSRLDGLLTVHGAAADGTPRHIERIAQIVCATGQRPDLEPTRELRLKLDPWLESTEALGPLIDPNLHSCGTVRPHGHRELAHPEPGFYTIGVKSYGRAPTFLMTTGYEQARSVVAALAGDLAAADRVELVLPETGVCSTDFASEGTGCCGIEPALVSIDEPAASSCAPRTAAPAAAATSSGCCGGPPQADASACCALDETRKAQGEAGCGCGAAPAQSAARTAARAGRCGAR